MGVPAFYTIRHGETAWNRDGRFQGSAGSALTLIGRAQVHANAVALQSLLGHIPATSRRMIASPVERAKESAAIAAQVLGVDSGAVRTDARLREASYGKWEGLTTYEVKAQFPDERRARKADRWNYAPPGGDSPAMMAEAVAEFLAALVEPECVLVTHTGTIRILHHLLGGLAPVDALATMVPHDKVFHWDGLRFTVV